MNRIIFLTIILRRVYALVERLEALFNHRMSATVNRAETYSRISSLWLAGAIRKDVHLCSYRASNRQPPYKLIKGELS